jgi:saccharopine dehydrogenase-like NADP-dependent oxidoreductase
VGARPRLVHDRPFSEPERYVFPDGIGEIECVNVEHEEVVLIPRWVDCRRVTFKYGLGDEFIDVLKTLHKLGLDSTEPVDVRGARVAPRDVVAATLPDPATLGERMRGRTCAGTYVTGTGQDGRPRATYLYHVADNERTMREDGAQAVVWQTAINPLIALELIDAGTWSGAGVLGPEAFDAAPFLDLLADHGAPHGVDERAP